MNNRVLPIFTLNTVIFPGATLPLRIFEDRYKKMLNHSVSKDSTFGINLIKQGYIQRTARGRVALDKTYQYLNLEKKD